MILSHFPGAAAATGGRADAGVSYFAFGDHGYAHAAEEDELELDPEPNYGAGGAGADAETSG